MLCLEFLKFAEGGFFIVQCFQKDSFQALFISSLDVDFFKFFAENQLEQKVTVECCPAFFADSRYKDAVLFAKIKQLRICFDVVKDGCSIFLNFCLNWNMHGSSVKRSIYQNCVAFETVSQGVNYYLEFKHLHFCTYIVVRFKKTRFCKEDVCLQLFLLFALADSKRPYYVEAVTRCHRIPVHH